MKILALTKYGSQAASTRQRFMQYELALAAAGMTVEYSPFFENEHLERLVAGRRVSRLGVLRGYLLRLRAMVLARNYDALWVHYEIFPYLPGAIERLGKWAGKPIVLDYDDATFHAYDDSPRPVVRWLLSNKLLPLLRSASVACCGNGYLQDYAARYCKHTIVLPTVVDTTRYLSSPRDEASSVVIGWIGSPSTWAFVRPLLPLLQEMVERFGVVIRAVGAGDAAKRDQFHGLELIKWEEASEIAAVQSMDIGIMPVPDRPFERGKCGYKLIQYMACGLPVVASPVGVNSQIVRPGENGLLATSVDEWRAALINLINDPALRRRFGSKSRSIAVRDYSLESQAPRLVDLFRSVSRTAP